MSVLGVITVGNKETILIKAGEKLKELRTVKGLSVHKVAKAVHISGTYLSELERGLKEPSDIVLQSIGNYYNVDLSEIFALYGRIAPAETDLLLKNPPFMKVITQMSIDERLTEDERKSISEELGKIYKKLVEGRQK